MSIFSLITGRPGASGFGSASTAEQVTEGIDAKNLTAIVTGQLHFLDLHACSSSLFSFVPSMCLLIK